MKKLITIFASIILMTLSANVMAQSSSATATATSTATIVSPISIVKVGDLAFGKIAANASSAGTVTLAPTGVRTNTGGTSLIAGTTSVTSFTVTGDVGATFSIALPASITISKDASTSMVVYGFTNSLGSNSSVLSDSGFQVFTVGATISVIAAQASGNYQGTYDVTVSYN